MEKCAGFGWRLRLRGRRVRKVETLRRFKGVESGNSTFRALIGTVGLLEGVNDPRVKGVAKLMKATNADIQLDIRTSTGMHGIPIKIDGGIRVKQSFDFLRFNWEWAAGVETQ